MIAEPTDVTVELASLRRRIAALENRKPPCNRCKGSGKQPGLHNKCGRCWGSGEEQ